MKTDFTSVDKEKFESIREKYREYESTEGLTKLWYIHNRYNELLAPSAIEEIYEPDVKKDDLFWVPDASEQDSLNIDDSRRSGIQKNK